MAILHIKSPNGNINDLDLSKIVFTNTNQTINGTKTFDRIKFADFGEIGSRLTEPLTPETVHHQFLLGANRVIDDWTSGGVILLYPYDEEISKNNGHFSLIASSDGYSKGLSVYPDGKIVTKTDIRIDIDSSGSNWIRYGNGIQICWGIFNNTALPFNMTYPVPFIRGPGLMINNGACNFANWSGTGNSVNFRRGATTASAAWVNYIAVGFWK